ncbi:MAG: hypothetical protein NZ942_04145, partial [Candidatus Aenigmarchaeota archaeon]|nr:hypothetical protein [Candidatus Aenigmarchaeota archaeon]
ESYGAVIRSPPRFEIEVHGDGFDPHTWNTTGPGIEQFFVKLVLLDASVSHYVCVNVTSSTSNISQGICTVLTANLRSLSEPGLFYVILLFLIGAIFIRLKFK